MEEEEEPQDFKVSVLHGESTRKLTGKYADAFSGSARGELAKDWCLRYGLQRSSRYGFGDFGADGSALMALAYCHRMQYFYDLYLERGGTAVVYTDEDIDGYQELAEFATYANGLTGAVLSRRVSELRRMNPLVLG